MICQHCNNEFSTLTVLKNHQKTAKYCMKLQNVNIPNIKCYKCDKIFTRQFGLDRHLTICSSNTMSDVEKQ